MVKKKKSHSHAHSHAKKTPLGKYVFGAVVFIVLVAVVAGLIWLAAKAGESRLDRQSKTAAVVNGEDITTAYLDDQYNKVPEMYRSYITKANLLNQTINEVILLQEAKKQGIEVSEENVTAEIQAALVKSGMTEKELDEKLKDQNVTKAELVEMYQKQLTINKLLDEVVFSDLGVDESDVEEFYDSRIRAMHILVDTKEEAEDIIDELKSSTLESIEDDFAALADEKSTDPSAAENHGDLGEFGKGQMVSEFEKAAFALEEYAFTAEPVKTQYGYHVILRLPKNETLDDQYNAIEEYLLTQKKSAAVELYLKQLRSKSNIQILYTEPASAESSE
ncbi:peptidylprolyl isomerase [Candidatus Woesearchaeota archaeon]|nr:peptidylprolyl isomerase [Candidatus Woesearchaeota archaeon]